MTTANEALHTFVVSDIHLIDAEPPHPRNPLWKKFKRPEYFTDQAFSEFLKFIVERTRQHSVAVSPIELVLNGDIFDFDSVMTLPTGSEFNISWIERLRGLHAEEGKSLFKIRAIIDTHPVWFDSLKTFVAKGNRVVFVIGNHDIELHWLSVQKEIIARLGLGEEPPSVVRFVEWFYISNGDTLIEHGNQYDSYGLCTNPINPVIKKRHAYCIRLPFGNIAGRYLLNGMGLMNPHSESSYIKSSIWEYLKFYYKYVARTQPWLVWTWLWSAMVCLVVTITEGLRPAVSDPLTIGERIDHIAQKSNATTKMVLALRELHAHPAALNPIQVLQELWLDRALLFGLVVFASFEFFLFLNVFTKVSILFFVLPFLILMPGFIFYARSIRSAVQQSQNEAFEKIPVAAKIAGVKRAILGHTHIAKHSLIEGIEYLNTGTWSPSFSDVECTNPYGMKCFAWIRPSTGASGGSERVAELFEWRGATATKIKYETQQGATLGSF